MDHGFDPIVLRYRGFDAESSTIDLGQFGRSIQGASRLLGSAGTIVLTGQFAKQSQALAVRVLAGRPQGGSYELPAIIVTVSPLVVPMLPIFHDAAKRAAARAVTGIVNYALARLGGRQSEAQMACEVAQKSITEMGLTSRVAIQAMERVVQSHRPAARLFVSPIGLSCEFAQIGDAENGAIEMARSDREVIESADEGDIGRARQFDIYLTELDRKNKTCKFSMAGDDDEERRVNGAITDPLLQQPNNPYSAALNEHRWITVTAKPETKDGDIERLYISDVS